MNPIRPLLVAFFSIAAAVAYGQPTPADDLPPRDAGPALSADAPDQVPPDRRVDAAEPENRQPPPDRPIDPERQLARDEFVRARAAFGAMTAAALTSDELARWAKGLTGQVRLRRAERDLRDAHEGMRMIEASGRGGTEEARRQAARIAAAEDEVARLHAAEAAGAEAAGAGVAVEGLPDRETIRRWMQAQMTEETERLADTLDTRELERRTRRLHRLTALAGMAGQFRRTNRGPGPVEIEIGPAGPDDGELGPAAPIMPAGGEANDSATVIVPVDGLAASGETGLGEPTTEPPALSPRVSLRATSRGDAPTDSPAADSQKE